MQRRTLLGAMLAASTAGLPSAALAQSKPGSELRIGMVSEPSSVDPHFAAVAGNLALSAHLFDGLVNVDPSGRNVPGLALSWETLDPTTWEFKLRQGVKFHDGSDFTADDVVFSLERPPKVAGSPAPFTSYTKAIVSMQVVDRHTVRLKTAEPFGPLLTDLSSVAIVSKKAATGASTEDFNSGKAAIGTGPFSLVQFKRGESVVLQRNAAYWGDKPAFEKVTLRFITADAARVAALLSGDVDMIEGVPPADMPRLKADAKLSVKQRNSWRTLLLQLNHAAPDKSAYFTDRAGKPLEHNPLKDARVRKALSLGINREALVQSTLEGLAQPAAQLVGVGLLGYNPAAKPEAYDPAAAKKLLAEAGFPDGFGIVLAAPNNRYINDEQVAQTIAQLWSRIGVQAKLDVMPMASYVPKMRNGEFGAALVGWGTMGGDTGLRTLLGTTNPEAGWGTWNWGKYSNPALDKLVHQSLATTDPAARTTVAAQAMTVAMQDHAALPTHYQFASWAMRKGLAYPGRIDEFTLSQLVRPE